MNAPKFKIGDKVKYTNDDWSNWQFIVTSIDEFRDEVDGSIIFEYTILRAGVPYYALEENLKLVYEVEGFEV